MATIFTDDFNRADGGLGASYTSVAGVPSIVSNEFAGAATDGLDYWNGGTPAANCYSKIRVVSLAVFPNYQYLGLRLDAGAGNQYNFGWSTAGADFGRFDSGVRTILGAGITAPTNGDVVLFEISGSTLNVYYNGTLQASRTDSTYTAAGRAGIGALGAAGRLDDFEVGELSVLPIMAEPMFRLRRY